MGIRPNWVAVHATNLRGCLGCCGNYEEQDIVPASKNVAFSGTIHSSLPRVDFSYLIALVTISCAA